MNGNVTPPMSPLAGFGQAPPMPETMMLPGAMWQPVMYNYNAPIAHMVPRIPVQMQMPYAYAYVP